MTKEHRDAIGLPPISAGPLKRSILSSRELDQGAKHDLLGRFISEKATKPYRGVSTSEGIVAGLFPLAKTGADLSSMRQAAISYLKALTREELASTRMPLSDPSWRLWANPAAYLLRHGVCLANLEHSKRALAMDLVRKTLSPEGFEELQGCMRLNLTLGEIRSDTENFNEWLYWMSIYGDPEGQAWGWQLDGHHVNFNCVIVGDQVVTTPQFLGSEPAWANSGKYAGTIVLQHEQDRGADLFTSLSSSQQHQARIGAELPHDIFTGAGRDNFEMNYQGLALSSLNDAQMRHAETLLKVFVERSAPQIAESRLHEVMACIGETHFAWIGDPSPDGVFYYRIHSPVILIEFEHQIGRLLDNKDPERFHIHTIVRTPNGNDYGKDLLRQHHEHWHHHGDGHYHHHHGDHST